MLFTFLTVPYNANITYTTNTPYNTTTYNIYNTNNTYVTKNITYNTIVTYITITNTTNTTFTLTTQHFFSSLSATFFNKYIYFNTYTNVARIASHLFLKLANVPFLFAIYFSVSN